MTVKANIKFLENALSHLRDLEENMYSNELNYLLRSSIIELNGAIYYLRKEKPSDYPEIEANTETDELKKQVMGIFSSFNAIPISDNNSSLIFGIKKESKEE
jgi:hypothetical protein